MEFSIQTLVIIFIAVVVALILIALITGWSGSSNNMISGLQAFFQNILAGKQTTTLPNV